MLISLSRAEVQTIVTRIALTTGPEDELFVRLHSLLTMQDTVVKGLTAAIDFLELGHMTDEALQQGIDAGLDDTHGIGNGKAKLTLQLRAALAQAEGSI